MNFIEPFYVFHLFGKAIPIAWLTIFGLAGSALFTARVLVQWIASERLGRSVVPVSFWWLSLAAAFIQIIYFVCRHNHEGMHDPDLPMIMGLSVTIVPYIRSLVIHYHPERPPRGGMQILLPAAVLIALVSYAAITRLEHQSWWIFGFGLAGVALFNMRFIFVWVRAEAERKASLPLSFWYLSAVGSVMLLIYGLLRGDLVVIMSFIFNTIPAARNIVLLRRQQKLAGPAESVEV